MTIRTYCISSAYVPGQVYQSKTQTDLIGFAQCLTSLVVAAGAGFQDYADPGEQSRTPGTVEFS